MKEFALSILQYLGWLSAAVMFTWTALKPHAENFVKMTVNSRFERVEGSLERLVEYQQEQRVQQNRIEAQVKAVLKGQDDLTQILKRK